MQRLHILGCTFLLFTAEDDVTIFLYQQNSFCERMKMLQTSAVTTLLTVSSFIHFHQQHVQEKRIKIMPAFKTTNVIALNTI